MPIPPLIIRLFFSVCLLQSAAYVLAEQPAKNTEFESTIGWLHGQCFAIKNSHLKENTRLLIIEPDTQISMPAKIMHKANENDECYALLDDRKPVNLESGMSFYSVSSDQPIELAIGLIDDAKNTPANLPDLNDDGQKDTYSYCNTAEGIRFSVWDGKAYQSRLLWSGYYYLGYDIEENCPALSGK